MIKGKNIKRILAVLMMALMMVSFMPAMGVFADETGDAPANEATGNEVVATENTGNTESTNETTSNEAANGESETKDTAKGSETGETTETTGTGETPAEQPAESENQEAENKVIKAYITISDGGKIVESQNGELVALAPIELVGKPTYSLDDAFKNAHEQYNKDGQSAYGTTDSQYGPMVSKFWGVENGGNYGYQINGGDVFVMGPTQEVNDGDIIDAYIVVNDFQNIEAYAKFDKFFVETTEGEEVVLTLTKATYDENFNMVFVPVNEAQIRLETVDPTAVMPGDGTAQAGLMTDENGKVTFVLNKAGEYYVIGEQVKDLDGKTVPTITAAVAKVIVAAKEASGNTEPEPIAPAPTTPTDDKKTEEKPAAAPQATKPAPAASTNAVPKTGDEQNVAIYAVILVVALAGAYTLKRNR